MPHDPALIEALRHLTCLAPDDISDVDLLLMTEGTALRAFLELRLAIIHLGHVVAETMPLFSKMAVRWRDLPPDEDCDAT